MKGCHLAPSLGVSDWVDQLLVSTGSDGIKQSFAFLKIEFETRKPFQGPESLSLISPSGGVNILLSIPPPPPLTRLFSEVLLTLDRLGLILINEM